MVSQEHWGELEANWKSSDVVLSRGCHHGSLDSGAAFVG